MEESGEPYSILQNPEASRNNYRRDDVYSDLLVFGARFFRSEQSTEPDPPDLRLHNEKHIEEQESSDEGKTMFWTICLANAILLLSQGIIPQTAIQLSLSLGLSKAKLGALQGFAYIVTALASPFAQSLLNWRKTNVQWLLVLTLIVHGFLVLLTFCWQTHWENNILIAIRAAYGIPQDIFCIFGMTWISYFAQKSDEITYRSIWQSVGIVSSLGGYGLGMAFSYINAPSEDGLIYISQVLAWRFPFGVQFVLEQMCILVLLWYSSDAYDIKRRRAELLISEEERRHQNHDIDRNGNPPSGNICSVLLNLEFMLASLAICALYFVGNGLLTWFTIYLEVVLEKPKITANLVFMTVAATSPTSGIVASIAFSRLFEKKLSLSIPDAGADPGKIYESKRNRVLLALTLGAIAGIASAFAAISTSFPVIVGSLYLVLFFGAWILPLLSTILMSTVNIEDKARASAIQICLGNILGFAGPSTLATQFVSNGKGEDEKTGWVQVWMAVCSASYVAWTCLLLHLLVIWCKERRRSSERQPEEETVDETSHDSEDRLYYLFSAHD